MRQALDALALPHISEALDAELAVTPPHEESRVDFLWRLIEPQLRARKERSVERRTLQARFPNNCSLDAFDFDFQPDLDRDFVRELATLEFVRTGHNLLIAGMSGTGKSHIAIALGHLACVAGYRVRYTTSAGMLANLQAGLATHDLPHALAAFTRPELLIIDEVGLDRPERDATRDAALFYKVVGPRHQHTRSTIITTNIDWSQWGKYLGDDLASVAILDRLIERGYKLVIEGPSYRGERHRLLNEQRASAKKKGSKTAKTSPAVP